MIRKSKAIGLVIGVLAFTWPLAAAVGWSRVRLLDHTPAQVLAGALVGACATGLLYPALR